ncbi:hypothetical protein N865_05570 [Intrasporangium oryzae NRRL B-24470]|uniref:MucB/RseB N-terminal domain-containing protein n=1 Tax=Intrasporangium oryzae NRRL B-24470 TaxID=1386089 RepID=W9G5D9_9MICO|nr:hypothetical protein [Intrasporangium oryzae]EWT01250.1 hypothetical protein N865_05570 [Intrasporangium oryzae NRRL B-24470]
MTYFAQHPRARWIAPTAAVAVIGATSFLVTRTATADAGLPPRTAAQLLADVQKASLESLSGTVVQTADLGLPQIPGLSGSSGGPGGASSSLTSLLAGSHTLRVWFAGPTQQRVAVIGNLGESDIIRNGTDLWLWSSHDKTAEHHVLGSGPKRDAAHADRPAGLPTGIPTGLASGMPSQLPTTPDQAAQQALAVLGTTTTVSTSGTAVVAGRQAYELVLAPKGTTTSRIAQIRIAIDAEKHIPLRVQVYSTKISNPAFEVGFTAVDFSKPDARQFAFNPPPGTTVTQSGSLKPGGAATNRLPSQSGTPATGTKPAAPKIVGTGWSTVAVTTLPAATDSAGATGATGAAGTSLQKQLNGILRSIPTVSGSWGRGHLLDGTLFSVALTDDGRVAVGAVAPEQLFTALSAK